MSQPAILLCGHGSRMPAAQAEFNSLLHQVRERCPDRPLQGAFLEFNSPTIPEGLQALYGQGARDIILQPVMLYNATHVTRDIPGLAADFSESHGDVQLRIGRTLGLMDPVIAAAVRALRTVTPEGRSEDCKLLVVGRGTRDQAVADQSVTLCRKLQERVDFGDSGYCYASHRAPLLENALAQAALSHYDDVIVLPFLLFPGRLLSDIYTAVDEAAQKYPAFTFIKAPHLGPQAAIADAVIQRFQEL